MTALNVNLCFPSFLYFAHRALVTNHSWNDSAKGGRRIQDGLVWGRMVMIIGAAFKRAYDIP